MERPNPLSEDSLVKLFSDHDIAKSFIDSFYAINKARSILKINEFRNNSTDFGLPSVTIVAELKNSYIYTVHIHAVTEKHFTEAYSHFWGKLMLEGVLGAKKYNHRKPTIHILFADYEWIDNKEFENELEFTTLGISRMLSADLLQLRVIELPKLRRKLERKRNADIVKDARLRWYAFFDSELTKPILRELMNADQMIYKAQELLEEE